MMHSDLMNEFSIFVFFLSLFIISFLSQAGGQVAYLYSDRKSDIGVPVLDVQCV